MRLVIGIGSLRAPDVDSRRSGVAPPSEVYPSDAYVTGKMHEYARRVMDGDS